MTHPDTPRNTVAWVAGPANLFIKRIYGELAAEYPAEVRCPFGHEGLIDADQLHGRVSMDCFGFGCSWHETHDLSALLA